jgi:hypothetical protein
MAGDRVQVERAVGLAAMEINSDADDCDVRRDKREEHNLPPRKMEDSIGKEIEQGIEQGGLPVEQEHSPDAADVKKVKATAAWTAFYCNRFKCL